MRGQIHRKNVELSAPNATAKPPSKSAHKPPRYECSKFSPKAWVKLGPPIGFSLTDDVFKSRISTQGRTFNNSSVYWPIWMIFLPKYLENNKAYDWIKRARKRKLVTAQACCKVKEMQNYCYLRCLSLVFDETCCIFVRKGSETCYLQRR